MLLLFWFSMIISASALAMEKNLLSTIAKPKVDTVWLKKSIYQALNSHRQEENNLSLKHRCFEFLVKNLLETKGSLAAFDDYNLPQEQAEDFKKWLNLVFATEWFRLCGNRYTPQVMEFPKLLNLGYQILPQVSDMSPNHRYLFLHNQLETVIYTVEDLIPRDPYSIRGELIGISIDSRYILMQEKFYIDNNEERIDFYKLEKPFLFIYDLLNEQLCCSCQFDELLITNDHYLIFEPEKNRCHLTNMIPYEKFSEQALINDYIIDASAELTNLSASPNTYVFCLEDLGTPLYNLRYSKKGEKWYRFPDHWQCMTGNNLPTFIESRNLHISDCCYEIPRDDSLDRPTSYDLTPDGQTVAFGYQDHSVSIHQLCELPTAT